MKDLFKPIAKPKSESLPDISAHTRSEYGREIEWVGMSQIELPVRLEGGVVGLARVDVAVSLDSRDSRGIHMSRLYQTLSQGLMEQELSWSLLKRLTSASIQAQQGLSSKGRIGIRFDQLVERKALVSEISGWRHYPVEMRVESLPQGSTLELGVEVLYSSTCPCSAALARALNQKRFQDHFSGHTKIEFSKIEAWLLEPQSVGGLPHAQRSRAKVFVRLESGEFAPSTIELIDRLEGALKTPVQAAVKREDEQEFSRLNAENLMFCEDAVRRLGHALDGEPRFAGYHVSVAHEEALHPHNATAEIYKNWPKNPK